LNQKSGNIPTKPEQKQNILLPTSNFERYKNIPLTKCSICDDLGREVLVKQLKPNGKLWTVLHDDGTECRGASYGFHEMGRSPKLEDEWISSLPSRNEQRLGFKIKELSRENSELKKSIEELKKKESK
jgi:hypothetical protein